MTYFQKIVIANRGEIAIRVMRACKELRIRSVALYSEADRFAEHTFAADEAIYIGPSAAKESYLSIEAVIRAAQTAHADAIHPGYGFLSENPLLPEACAAAGITFIGPSADTMRMMGSKTAAREAATRNAVPVAPGYQEKDQSAATLKREAKRIGYPVLIKAAAGGGGKGMREVFTPDAFEDALNAAKREAAAAFGDDTIFLEKLIQRPRHIEFQIMADSFGNCIYIGERECSIQRRHQKIIEETPSPALTPELRAQMGAAAVRAAQSAGYVNAGTVEFLLDQDNRFYFLEMNTRLQVEHPITEQVYGLDLVRLQIAVAAGEPLSIQQQNISPRGHAIEARIYAEDPQSYLPSTGKLLAYLEPQGPGIRVDSGVKTGSEISMYYDPMVAKLIATAPDRAAAIQKMTAALEQYAIIGVTTNAPLLHAIMTNDRFRQGDTSTAFLTETHIIPEQYSANEYWLHTALAACAIFEYSGGTSATAARPRSPWQAAALKSGAFTAKYCLNETTYSVKITPDTARHAFYITVNNRGALLDESVEPQSIEGRYDVNSNRCYLRQGSVQRIITIARIENTLVAVCGLQKLEIGKPQPLNIDSAAKSAGSAPDEQSATVKAPMAGAVIQVKTQVGDIVEARQPLIIMSAMKMEHSILAPYPARVARIYCKTGDVVAGGAKLADIEPITN